MDTGQLRPGPVPHLLSSAYFGLGINNIAVGFVYGLILRTRYPFFNQYLNLEAYQIIAAFSLINFAFTLKTFLAILTDRYPILGLRRKPYLQIGWTLCAISLLLATIRPLPRPDENPLQPSPAQPYIILLSVATFGLVLASVADDGMMVEWAAREPAASRGSLQSTIYVLRTLASALAYVLSGFLLNGRAYGGGFDCSISIQVVFGVASGVSWMTLPITQWCLREDRLKNRRMRWKDLWMGLQSRVMIQVLAFFFLHGLFSEFSNTAVPLIKKRWVKVQPFPVSIFGGLGGLACALAIYVSKKYCLQTSWRKVIVGTAVCALSLDLILAVVTVYDYYRNDYFWMILSMLENVPQGMNYWIASLVVVELAPEGLESTTYALLTTVRHITKPFSGSLTRWVNSNFRVFASDIALDSAEVRRDVMVCYGIMYGMHLLANVWLFLLPDQKQQVKRLKEDRTLHPVAGAVALGIFTGALLWALVTSILPFFPSTACLAIAGGKGC